MSTMNNFLWEQLEAQKETWKAAHDEAMACYDIEDQIRRGIALFGMIRLADEGWTRNVKAGNQKFDDDTVRFFQQQYQNWLAPCARVLATLEQAERSFNQVENAAYFRQCVALARRLVFVEIDGLIESGHQVANGQVEQYNAEINGDVANQVDHKGEKKLSRTAKPRSRASHRRAG